jgi:hypothetical protein
MHTAPLARPGAPNVSRSASGDAARLVYPDRRWERAFLGVDSHYLWTMSDGAGALLDGGKRYRLHLPAGIPVTGFCSIAVCETFHGRLHRTERRIHAPTSEGVSAGRAETETGIDVFFAPACPRGCELQWLCTAGVGSWFALLRFCGPLDEYFEQRWRPDDIVAEHIPWLEE